MNWRNDANCSSSDAEIFFPEIENDYAEYRLKLRVAKNICSECIVQNECLEDALKNKSLGIWAGTDEKDRARMLNKTIYRKKDLFDLDEYRELASSLGVKYGTRP